MSCGEAGEGARFGGAVAVFLDEGAQGGVAVEGGAAESGRGGDGGEGDGLAVGEELAQACSTRLMVSVLVIRLGPC